MYHSLHLMHSIHFVFGKSCMPQEQCMHTFSMVLTAFFTLCSFLNGNMIICLHSKHIVKCNFISNQLKRYWVGFSPYARSVAKAIAKIPHSDVSDLIILSQYI